MINAKDVYKIINKINKKTKQERENLLRDAYLESIYADINNIIIMEAINNNKFKVTYKPKFSAIDIKYKNKIEKYLVGKGYEVKFKYDTTNKYIMYIILNSDTEVFREEFRTDKILNNIPSKQIYRLLKKYIYPTFEEDKFNKILEEIGVRPSWNKPSENFSNIFSEIERDYNRYYVDPDGIKARKLFIKNEYYRLFEAGVLSYDSDTENIEDLADNDQMNQISKYQFFYKELERRDIIKENKFYIGESNLPPIGNFLTKIFKTNGDYIYDPTTKKVQWAKYMEGNDDYYIKLLLDYLYKADAMRNIMRYINNYCFEISSKSYYYSNIFYYTPCKNPHKREPSEEERKKYAGLSDDLMCHIYFARSGVNKLLTLERSPEVSRKSLYDRLRIQFSILGVNNRKKYFEDNKDEILKYIIGKASENKFFKSVPINCFEITNIDMTKSGDVTIIMELKQELLNIEKEIVKENGKD